LDRQRDVAGREYLARVDAPDPPVPRQANVSVTQQLVDDVVAAGGSLRVPRKQWSDREAVDYESRARLAERFRKVPPGKRLAVSVIDDEHEIRLVDAPELAAAAELVPVAVPEEVNRYHSAARQFRDRSERHEVSRALIRRATRIIHAVAIEAERREWSVGAPPDATNGQPYWSAAKNGHLQITAQGETFWLRLHEHGVHKRGPQRAGRSANRGDLRTVSRTCSGRSPSGSPKPNASPMRSALPPSAPQRPPDVKPKRANVNGKC
jgi:hypothetical protein